MTLLYHLFLTLFYFGALIASVFNEKAKTWIAGRKNLFKLLKQTVKEDEKVVWFHCASLGEFEQGRPVIEELKRRNPNSKILLTFFSSSGYEIRKDYPIADYIFYLPVDFRKNAIRFINIAKPAAVYFVKYEFWFNYIDILHLMKIPVYCISANFRPDQVFFKWYGKWYKSILYKFTHIYVQNIRSKDLLATINIHNVSVSGDTRFDRVAQIASQAKSISGIDCFKNGEKVIVAGSTWPSDEEILVKYINRSNSKNKFIIAPHEIKPLHIENLIKSITKKTLKYSQTDILNPKDFDVLIIDNIGILSSVYQYGNIAYVGGGFGKGIHNILEPASFGLPVVFGPNFKKFQEAIDLIDKGGAFVIIDFNSLEKVFNRLTNDLEFFQNTGKLVRDYVVANTGASLVILADLK